MIYSEYVTLFYKDPRTERAPVKKYINHLNKKDRGKIIKYIEYLRINEGVLDEPYTRHLRGKLRELRVDFATNRHRILYFLCIGKTIVFVHAFLKKTEKTPEIEIIHAEQRMNEYLKHLAKN